MPWLMSLVWRNWWSRLLTSASQGKGFSQAKVAVTGKETIEGKSTMTVGIALL
jgi:hypothetical protein